MKAFTPLVLIAIAVASYFMYLKPTYDKIQVLSAQKDRYSNVLEKSKELAVRRDTILSSYTSIAPSDIARLKKVIPEKFDSVLLAKHISTIGASYGLTIKGIRVIEPQTDTRQVVVSAQNSQYKTLSASFTTKGTYDQFVKFLKDIESGLYLMDISSISIHGDQKSTIMDYSVTLLTYSFN